MTLTSSSTARRGDRADHISGDDFEYDTKNEIIRAIGIVHLDLQAPEAEGANTTEASKHLAGPLTVNEDTSSGGRVIHVKTSGLVFLKKLGIAATNEGIEFSFGGFTGHAVGAEYNSDTGRIVLQSTIAVSGVDRSGRDGGRPVALAASHGELDRASEVAAFNNARYTSAGQIAQPISPASTCAAMARSNASRVSAMCCFKRPDREVPPLTAPTSRLTLQADRRPPYSPVLYAS